jgi:hypothetical protein
MRALPKATRAKGVCPTCGKPLRRYVEQKETGSYEFVEKGFQCPNEKCAETFFSRQIDEITRETTFTRIADFRPKKMEAGP